MSPRKLLILVGACALLGAGGGYTLVHATKEAPTAPSGAAVAEHDGVPSPVAAAVGAALPAGGASAVAQAVAAPPLEASFDALVERYAPLEDAQLTAVVEDVNREMEAKDLIRRANENHLDDAERDVLRALLRRHNAVQAVRTQRLLAAQGS